MATAAVHKPRSSKTESYVESKRKDEVRQANIVAARTVADAVRTSLRPKPKGMDKMISTASVEVVITKMLVELFKSQDIVAGDRTTTVAVIAGALRKQCSILLNNGIHPTVISESLHKVSQKAVEILTAMALPVELSDRESLV